MHMNSEGGNTNRTGHLKRSDAHRQGVVFKGGTACTIKTVNQERNSVFHKE